MWMLSFRIHIYIYLIYLRKERNSVNIIFDAQFTHSHIHPTCASLYISKCEDTNTKKHARSLSSIQFNNNTPNFIFSVAAVLSRAACFPPIHSTHMLFCVREWMVWLWWSRMEPTASNYRNSLKWKRDENEGRNEKISSTSAWTAVVHSGVCMRDRFTGNFKSTIQ